MVNTFLPYPDFRESVRVLDYRRLGKQRAEVKQIANALEGVTKGWRKTPMVRMWEGYEYHLLSYGMFACIEWAKRGYEDNLYREFAYRRQRHALPNGSAPPPPPWMGDYEFHRSHQSNLIRKYPEHYRPIFGDDVPDDLPYVWPSPTIKENNEHSAGHREHREQRPRRIRAASRKRRVSGRVLLANRRASG